MKAAANRQFSIPVHMVAKRTLYFFYKVNITHASTKEFTYLSFKSYTQRI